MRKRSGAIDSDTMENYIKLAIKTQNKQNIFYSDEYLKEEHKSQEKRLSKDTLDFDYEKSNTYQFESNSFPPNNLNLLKTKNSFKENIIINNVEEASSSSLFAPKNIEKVCKSTVKKLMVIGEKTSGRKSFINSFFRNAENIIDGSISSGFSKGLSQNGCLDLICKNHQINEREKVIYKFWIQNLSSEKFEDIINVYYKTVNAFIFVYDVEKKSSLEKIKKNIETIKISLNIREIHGVLIGMHNKNGLTDIDYSEALRLSHDENLRGFYKFYRGTSNDYAKLLEILIHQKKIENIG